jgi:hypothetical protein
MPADSLEGEQLARQSSFRAWRERAENTRGLAERVSDGRVKQLLLIIAETYERLAHSQ